MNIFADLNVNKPGQENNGLHFYVITKREARFKRITIQIDSVSTVDSAQNQLRKYIESSRLIQTVMLSEKQCQVNIGPNAPHIQRLKEQLPLILEGREVVQINQMTRQDYVNFAEDALLSVKTAVESFHKQKADKKPEADKSVSGFSPLPSQSNSKKEATIFTYYIALSRVQQTIHQCTMSMLVEMREMRKRIADYNKEHDEKKIEKRRLDLKKEIEDRIVDDSILVNQIKAKGIKASA